MTLFDNLITVFVLVVLFLIIYLKVSHKTLPEFFRDIREIFANTEEEVGGL